MSNPRIFYFHYKMLIADLTKERNEGEPLVAQEG
jgi:hypothetical protein